MPEVAFVTCARLPDLDADDRLVIEPLASLGCSVTAVVWDDPAVAWDRFDVSVLRSTWDYTTRRDEFVRWARAVPRLLNPAHVVEWNTDKRYLRDLARAGVSVVPTTWISDAADADLPSKGEYVLKPSVGAGSLDADRFNLADPASRARAGAHADALLARGQTVLAQPFASAIETAGETGVILIEGELSHAIRKGPMLGPSAGEEVNGLYKEEMIEGRSATTEELDVARAALRAAADVLLLDSPLLYARIDMVPGDDGRPVVMELELTEPSLFMATTPGSERRFASAIANRANREAGRAPQRSEPGLSRRGWSPDRYAEERELRA